MLEGLLHAAKDLALHERRVLPVMDFVLLRDLADVEHVGEEPVEAGLGEAFPPCFAALLCDPPFLPPAPGLQLLYSGDEGLALEIELEDGPDPGRLLLVDQEPPPPGVHVEAQDRPAPGPFPLAPRGGDLVPGPLGDDLPLELGEGEENVQGQAPHGTGGVELLGDGDEGDMVGVENLHDLGEIEQAPGEAVHLVDHDAIDLPGLHAGEKPPHGRPVHVAAAEPAVVVPVLEAGPAFALLARDVGLAGLPLGVEGVELLLQTLVGGLPSIDGAPDHPGFILLSCHAPSLSSRAQRSGIHSSGCP